MTEHDNERPSNERTPKEEPTSSERLGARGEEVDQRMPPAATSNDTDDTQLNPYAEISPG